MTMILILWSTRCVRYGYDCVITTTVTTPWTRPKEKAKAQGKRRTNVDLNSLAHNNFNCHFALKCTGACTFQTFVCLVAAECIHLQWRIQILLSTGISGECFTPKEKTENGNTRRTQEEKIQLQALLLAGLLIVSYIEGSILVSSYHRF